MRPVVATMLGQQLHLSAYRHLPLPHASGLHAIPHSSGLHAECASGEHRADPYGAIAESHAVYMAGLFKP